MRIIALDIHQAFAEAAVPEDGVCKRIGWIRMTRDHLREFAKTLYPTNCVIVEATGNATAVLEIPAPKVEEVAVANPFQVHLIAGEDQDEQDRRPRACPALRRGRSARGLDTR